MKIYFIGIGGIGVSALARYFLTQGFEVSGSDVSRSDITKELEKIGAKVFIGHKAGNLLTANFDKVVYSAAVQDDNPELIEARARDIECRTYAQALGELTKKYFTIAVSGTHGKSTTTAMIGLILEAAGLDPTVIIGTKVSEWGSSNYRAGKSQYLVIEADEYAASFLNYWPKIIVLTNIEEEHLDFYTGGLPQILETFKEYLSHLGKDGALVANEEDKNIQKIIRGAKFKIKNFKLSKVAGLKLKVHGLYNLSNAAAAISAARVLCIADRIAVKALNNFNGTWRRMEFKGKLNGAKIYDDYGHHPTEIKATLQGARELLSVGNKRSAVNDGQLWCVFQPHQYQRTYQLFEQFVGAFDAADRIILLPIYSVAGREKSGIKKKVSSEKLAACLKARSRPSRSLYLDSFDKAEQYLTENLQKEDICVIMGAGDIYKLTEKLKLKN